MKYYGIPAISNSKNPACPWKRNKALWTFYNKTPKANHLFLTGVYVTKKDSTEKLYHNNGIIVLDIDYTKEKHKGDTSEFADTFGDIDQLVKRCNTYTVKTCGGGYHLYFKYTEDLWFNSVPIKNKKGESTHVDFLSNDHVCVGVNTKVKDNVYKVVNNKKVKDIPEDIKKYIIMQRVLNTKTKGKVVINLKKSNDFVKRMGEWYYDIPDKVKDMIIKNIDVDKLSTFKEWFKFTTFCKVIGSKDKWNIVSKSVAGYDAENNEAIWQSIDANKMSDIVPYFLKITDTTDLAPYFEYAPTQNLNKTKPYLTIDDNRKKLGYTFIEDYPDDNLVIRSDTGTGKTTTFKHYIGKSGKPFLSIVSRKSLAHAQYIAFSEHGLDVQLYTNTEGAFKNGLNYIVQIDSIMKANKLDYKDYTIFLDEFNSIVEYIVTSSTLDNKRTYVLKKFIDVLANAERVICVDADISDICFTVLDYAHISYKYIINPYKHNQNVNAYEIDDYEKLKEKLLKTPKWLLCCDTAKEAEIIHTWLAVNGKKVALYIRNTKSDNIDLDDDDCVIYSPKIIYGLDSVMERDVFTLYDGSTINPANMKQQVARCRNIKTLYFSFINKAKEARRKPDSFTSFVNKKMVKLERLLEEFHFLVNEDMKDFYFDIYTKTTYRNECYASNKYLHFKMLLRDSGFVVYDPDYTKMFECDKAEKTKLTKMAKEKRFEGVDLYTHPLNDYLLIPKDKIEAYENLFHSQHEVMNHFNISKYLFDPHNKIETKLTNKKDFNMKVAESNLYKIYKLKEYASLCGFKNDFEIRNKLSKKQVDAITQFYKDNSKSQTKKIESVDTIIGKMAKQLFGNLVKSKQVRKDGIRTYKYIINDDVVEYHKTLYYYRQTGYVTHTGEVKFNDISLK